MIVVISTSAWKHVLSFFPSLDNVCREIEDGVLCLRRRPEWYGTESIGNEEKHLRKYTVIAEIFQD